MVCVVAGRSAEDNQLSEVEAGALAGARGLRVLRLARNRLRAPPTAALRHTSRLQALLVPPTSHTTPTLDQTRTVH